MEIKAVFCGLGNVLARFGYRPTLLYCMAVMVWREQNQVPLPYGMFRERLAATAVLDQSQTGEGELWLSDTGKITSDQLYAAFLQAAALDCSQVPPERFWPAYFSHLSVIPETCAVIREVQKRGMPVIAATNGDGWLPTDLLCLQAAILWDGIVMSWQVGYKKPALEFFYECKAAAQLALRSDGPIGFDQCLLIDDVPGHTAAFEGFGGRAICFNTTKQPASDLRAALVRFGVLPA